MSRARLISVDTQTVNTSSSSSSPPPLERNTTDISNARYTHVSDTEELDLEEIRNVVPLRVGLQILGLWQPKSVPKVIGWIHYLLFLSLSLWFVVWKIYFMTIHFDASVAILRGFDSVVLMFLWIFVPYAIYRRGHTFINGIQFICQLQKKKKVSVIHGVVYVVLLIPQLSYALIISLPILEQDIEPILPWGPRESHLTTFNIFLLAMGMVLGVLCVNTTLLFLAISAHLQSFLIIDLEKKILSPSPITQHGGGSSGAVRITTLKSFILVTIQSLREGNEALEAVNGSLAIGLLIALVEVVSTLVFQPDWDLNTLIPLLLVLFQIYFFLFPAAYISSCWDMVFERCLQMHALAPRPEEELGPIVLYMTHVYDGYHITNIRIDSNKLFYFTYVIITLLVIKAQNNVQKWIL